MKEKTKIFRVSMKEKTLSPCPWVDLLNVFTSSNVLLHHNACRRTFASLFLRYAFPSLWAEELSHPGYMAGFNLGPPLKYSFFVGSATQRIVDSMNSVTSHCMCWWWEVVKKPSFMTFWRFIFYKENDKRFLFLLKYVYIQMASP